jgi:hypothetical protein
VAGVLDLLGGAGWRAATEVALSKLYLGRMIAAQANALAFRDTFIVLGLAAAVAAVLGLVVSRRRI